MNQDQFELTPYADPEPKKKGRGKGVKPALCYVGIRIDKDVLEYYNQFPNRQAAIRTALYLYMKEAKENQSATE
jgi:uncharacterized protein (DUF4415 family)